MQIWIRRSLSENLSYFMTCICTYMYIYIYIYIYEIFTSIHRHLTSRMTRSIFSLTCALPVPRKYLSAKITVHLCCRPESKGESLHSFLGITKSLYITVKQGGRSSTLRDGTPQVQKACLHFNCWRMTGANPSKYHVTCWRSFPLRSDVYVSCTNSAGPV